MAFGDQDARARPMYRAMSRLEVGDVVEVIADNLRLRTNS